MKEGYLKLCGILFLLTIFLSISVLAQATPPTPSPFPSANHTFLIAKIAVEEHNTNENLMKARVLVKNIGQYPATNVNIELQNIPEGWEVLPSEDIEMQTLSQGESRTITFTITKDETESTIYAIVSADNAQSTSTNEIPIPVFFTTIIIFGASAISLFFLRRKNAL